MRSAPSLLASCRSAPLLTCSFALRLDEDVVGRGTEIRVVGVDGVVGGEIEVEGLREGVEAGGLEELVGVVGGVDEGGGGGRCGGGGGGGGRVGQEIVGIGRGRRGAVAGEQGGLGRSLGERAAWWFGTRVTTLLGDVARL